MRALFRPCALLVPLAVACSTSAPPVPADATVDHPGTTDASVPADVFTPVDAGPPDDPTVTAAVARWCGPRRWSTTRMPATVNTLTGTYAGRITHGIPSGPVVAGTLETQTVIPDHPFLVRSIRVAFASGSGHVRIRLETSFGRSVPSSALPAGDVDGEDLVPPVELDVTNATPDHWMDLDVSAAHAVLQPGALYHIVYEHQDADPTLALESVPMGADNNGLLFVPGDVNSYGVPGNYRMQLTGDYLCAIAPADRTFQPVATAVFAGQVSGNIHVVDLDGDGHDDLVAPGGDHPVSYLGDGHGGFTLMSPSPFPAAETARTLMFGDLDNDGDEDAVAMVYVQSDNDGDTVATFEHDCDDTNADVRPGRPGGEVAGNGKDDDCDGVADDGTSTADMDHDGVSIAMGDCDDTEPTVHPGAPEIQDNRDNNCNHQTDEGFTHHVLLNDGHGHFTPVPTSGVEVQGPTLAAAMDDADGDGRLDAYIGFWLRHYPDAPTQPSLFYLGNGDGTFREATAAAHMTVPTAHPVYGVMWNDWNNDGRPDLYVGTYQLQDNYFFRNDGAGLFTNTAALVHLDHDEIPTQAGPAYPGGHSYGGDFGDWDGDGDLDAILCNLSHPRTMPWADPTMFVINQGPPGYDYVNSRTDVGLAYNEGDGNAQFGDIDNDGDLDVYIASFYGKTLRVLRNDGGQLVDITYETGIHVHSGTGVWTDFDGDGDLDFASADNSTTAVYLNQLHGPNHWLEFRTESTVPGVNRDAVGARITVVSGAHTFLRDVRLTGGLVNRQPSRWVHVGLGTSTDVTTMTVRWPGGTMERFTGVTADHRWVMRQGTGTVTAGM